MGYFGTPVQQWSPDPPQSDAFSDRDHYAISLPADDVVVVRIGISPQLSGWKTWLDRDGFRGIGVPSAPC